LYSTFLYCVVPCGTWVRMLPTAIQPYVTLLYFYTLVAYLCPFHTRNFLFWNSLSKVSFARKFLVWTVYFQNQSLSKFYFAIGLYSLQQVLFCERKFHVNLLQEILLTFEIIKCATGISVALVSNWNKANFSEMTKSDRCQDLRAGDKEHECQNYTDHSVRSHYGIHDHFTKPYTKQNTSTL